MLHSKSDEIWIDSPNVEIEKSLDKQFPRIGFLRWRVRTGYFQKVISFLNAVKGGKTSVDIAKDRLAVCNACPGLRTIAGRKFCGACSCGTWMLAELNGGPSPKLEWADLKCPLNRW